MMPTQPLHEQLKPILQALKSLNGKLTFTDETGQEFVLMMAKQEKQLTFHLQKEEDEESSAYEEINTDVFDDMTRALSEYASPEEELDEIKFDQEQAYPIHNEDNGSLEITERRIRFEPIDGDDLSPDLQG